MKDVFGFKKNKCKARLPEVHTKIFDFASFEGENLIDSVQAGSHALMWLDISEHFPEIETPIYMPDWFPSVSLLSTNANNLPPTLVIGTSLGYGYNSEGLTAVLQITFYNPTSFDMPLASRHERFQVKLIEDV